MTNKSTALRHYRYNFRKYVLLFSELSDDKNPTEKIDEDIVEIVADNTNVEILQMIGKEPENSSELKFQEEVKTIWRKFMSEGLLEKTKNAIIEKYPREGELHAEAPKINLEVQPVVTEIAKKRDQHFINTQNSAGSAIVALSAAVSMIVNQSEEALDYTKFVGYLCDAGKLLADIFYQISITRRSFITPLLNKAVKPTIEATKPDEKYLYGDKFAEQVKEAKAVEKACSQIKAIDRQPLQIKTFSGNWRNPPVRTRQVGAYQNRRIFLKNRQRKSYTTPSSSSTRSKTQSTSHKSSRTTAKK